MDTEPDEERGSSRLQSPPQCRYGRGSRGYLPQAAAANQDQNDPRSSHPPQPPQPPPQPPPQELPHDELLHELPQDEPQFELACAVSFVPENSKRVNGNSWFCN